MRCALGGGHIENMGRIGHSSSSSISSSSRRRRRRRRRREEGGERRQEATEEVERQRKLMCNGLPFAHWRTENEYREKTVWGCFRAFEPFCGAENLNFFPCGDCGRQVKEGEVLFCNDKASLGEELRMFKNITKCHRILR
jgi:hypothetical protein